MNTTREYKGFRLIDGTIDNDQCPHLHMIEDAGMIRCQTCGVDSSLHCTACGGIGHNPTICE